MTTNAEHEELRVAARIRAASRDRPAAGRRLRAASEASGRDHASAVPGAQLSANASMASSSPATRMTSPSSSDGVGQRARQEEIAALDEDDARCPVWPRRSDRPFGARQSRGPPCARRRWSGSDSCRRRDAGSRANAPPGSPASLSGKTMRSAPTLARISPWMSVSALAMTQGTPIRFRISAQLMLSSMF